jgi:hypothetical protein
MRRVQGRSFIAVRKPRPQQQQQQQQQQPKQVLLIVTPAL